MMLFLLTDNVIARAKSMLGKGQIYLPKEGFKRALSWAEVSHMLITGGDTGDWRLEASLASPGAQTLPGLNIPAPQYAASVCRQQDVVTNI